MTAQANACIGLGANLGHPEAALRRAVDALAALPDTRLLAVSRFYRTAAWGRTDQPDFINAAALLRTGLAPQALLAQLLEIERQAGRQRDGDAASTRWGPRVLDLDLLLYGGQVVDEPGLRVPHPCLHERAFALLPLAEIAPAEPFPGHGSVADALRGVDTEGVLALDDA
ncbi:2-amino-4-hydroxy-6-hydroxymethyldihydropteridine diphosphokinase [Pseudoxanthomonas broegbernensis]|uniref:2-amino-4-hydroxy-6-hydroxymethyldihydropteridine pyrophosphokinase n=1 Tax=Pseudoxanthomonas broegbernensis TaxID=83619 RepID=A0A7V8GK65_9GAMM|nr:2-amino-4-hydroxy-6-hydroxymethyldihydropteridine diphosphokinase [Pseudoxanthomonas broegbernensis]KAF1684832.1 2-amino-4-hydroxy-6-hydroxymethyldihydropteridine diphosphokinase [Pseudoxanthomonas broegbernensis]MBB6065296.1 2-amino-4-hydroxy-6-hydroxymethyldihydropteridine diphosphokinase [Pseudoxanthomonas broegbernensis]